MILDCCWVPLPDPCQPTSRALAGSGLLLTSIVQGLLNSGTVGHRHVCMCTGRLRSPCWLFHSHPLTKPRRIASDGHAHVGALASVARLGGLDIGGQLVRTNAGHDGGHGRMHAAGSWPRQITLYIACYVPCRKPSPFKRGNQACILHCMGHSRKAMYRALHTATDVQQRQPHAT